MTIHSPGKPVHRLTLDDAALADMFYLALSTVQRNVSRSPSTLPPFVKIGKKIIWITQIAVSWNSDVELRTPVVLDLRELPQVLDSYQLAEILHIPEESIGSMYRSRSRSSPPPRGVHGWVTHDVFKWLVEGLVGLPETARIELKAPILQLHQVPARRSIGNDLSLQGRGER